MTRTTRGPLSGTMWFHRIGAAAAAALLLLLPGTARAAGPSVFSALRWRMIGPFRGGRTVAAVGVPGRPHEFLIGVNNGGVWKTTDAGRTWFPIFDDQPTQSIGAIAIAPSNPDIIYVGSGEGLQRPDLSVGDGIYRSRDGGRSWRHLGLSDGQQIPALVVDPRDPNRLFAAVLGHPYGPNRERGVFRSTDGGETWRQVLDRGVDTGAIDVLIDPNHPETVFAVTWSARQGPWEAELPSISSNNALWKSTDGGSTWRAIRAGIPPPDSGLGRIGIAAAPSAPGRFFAIVSSRRGGGLYRSDDDGENWRLVNTDPRLAGRDGDFDEVRVDPRRADVVYVANVVTWKSVDGGRAFTAWRGAPGGDDYHRLWISPDDSNVILLAADQGAIVTLNGGDSWSSWYNQPTAQFFHVATDGSFPYRVYGGQQESGSAAVRSRGDDGQITFRDWHPVGAEEYGYVAPDPLDPNLVYGGKLTRFDWRTGDVQEVSPDPLRSAEWRWVRTMPVVFSAADPRALYLGANVLFETTDGARTWRVISPDLTRPAGPPPPSMGAFAPLDPEHGQHRGVIYTIAPSPLAEHLLWVGTDDGLVQVTHDGGASWSDVTPPPLTPWSKVSMLEASHFDTLESYAAINRFRLDDLAPHAYRTRDGGRHWTEIVAGIATDEVVNAVREDPKKRGLLYAATERGVWVSFDDGDHWQGLRLDLPATSVRDLVVHDDDLVIGTHGRSFWILDDATPLRQAAEAAAARGPFLYAPATAMRVRWNRNTDTPLPPDEPAGENPPDGAILDYQMDRAATGAVTLEILDERGGRVRRWSSLDPPDTVRTQGETPAYWIRPNATLASSAGAHRFVWDLHGAPLATRRRSYSIAAVVHQTPADPRGPWVLPGDYRVRLSLSGKVLERPLRVALDPRVKTSPADLERQFALATRLGDLLRRDSLDTARARALRSRLSPPGRNADADSIAARVARLEGAAREFGPPRTGTEPATFARLEEQILRAYTRVEETDAAPTPALEQACAKLGRDLDELDSRLGSLESQARELTRSAR